MKKLMVMLVAVAAAVVANAGAIAWSAIMVGDSPDVTVKQGTSYTAYLFVVSSDVSLSGITGLLAEQTTAGNAVAKASGSYTSTATTATATSISFIASKTGGVGSYGTKGDEEVSAFMIVVDAGSIADAKNYLVMKDGDGNNVLTRTFGTSGDQTYSWGKQNTNNNWVEIKAVPEPTSALLLLLGVAGLALRRKQA